MGSFDWHPDVHRLAELRGAQGREALGLFIRAGSWTATHGRTGLIRHPVARELSEGKLGPIDRLVRAELWQDTRQGYRMLRGPNSGPEAPGALWWYATAGRPRQGLAPESTSDP